MFVVSRNDIPVHIASTEKEAKDWSYQDQLSIPPQVSLSGNTNDGWRVALIYLPNKYVVYRVEG